MYIMNAYLPFCFGLPSMTGQQQRKIAPKKSVFHIDLYIGANFMRYQPPF